MRLCQDRPIDLSKNDLGILHQLLSVPGLESSIHHLTLTCVLYEFPSLNRQGHSGSHANQLILDRWKERAEAEKKNLRPLDFSIEADKLWAEKRLSEQQDFSGEDMCAMLTAPLCKLRSLKTITLTAHVVGPDRRNYRLPEDVERLNWRELWAHAIQAYRVVISAIARSQVSIEGLHIYRGVKLCGVPTNEASMPLDRPEDSRGFAIVSRRLKSFSIRLASVVDPIRPNGSTPAADTGSFYNLFDISQGRRLDFNDRDLVDSQSDPAGVARLLHLMPNLESLDLHFYTKIVGGHSETAPYRTFLPTVIQDLRLPNLKNLALGGFWAAEESTRRLISNSPDLRALSLRRFRLTDGSWEPIFATIAQARSLTQLYLSDLHSPSIHMLIDFKTAYMNLSPSDDTSGHDRFPGLDGDPMWEMRVIGPDELRRGLAFPRMSEGGMASRESWFWMLYQGVEFGPLFPWGD
ncbi:uncharacterized protein DNG_01101 [Cephalotrichum gorgonifer]|uniref:F-box domain-containing protein n=1 Tax=Cephalotrichum gorgonifer TaxID=2041049 RepID=A0AAE8SRC2_9PEZI|nr:uncharacterized protein DNG_01101 [Cephalotrichum gorgonifer]